LREYVRSKVPEYMVPSVFVAIEEMPLTANGKLDRKRLPSPQFEQRENVVAPRESTELQLFQIWSDVLRREDFGVRDNFFDLGGHSFAAMTLMSRVSELYQRKIAIRTIFECPTIELLARYLQEEVACAPPSVIVPIQPRGTRRPFFAVHPLGGLVHYYIPLARRLGKEQPFYGIQVYGIDVGQTPLSVMEEVAAIYVEDMRRIQPAGPYQLGGYSFGAVVAYEMAQQLYAAGEEVSLLVLIDTTAPTADDDTLSSAGEAIPEPELENLPEWLGMFGLHVDESEMEATSVQDFAERYMRRHGIKGDLSTYLQLYRATEANLIAKRHYRAKPYPGRIALFRGNAPGEPDSGWSRLAPDRVSVYHFDIAHDYFLFEINIEAVAARLSSCLAQSASPGPLSPEALPAVGGERPRPLSGGAGTTPS
jgi:thioesterase domain-containing protein/acyl carrier protein